MNNARGHNELNKHERRPHKANKSRFDPGVYVDGPRRKRRSNRSEWLENQRLHDAMDDLDDEELFDPDEFNYLD